MTESLFNNVAGLRHATLSKKRLAQVFPCEFCEISKNTFFTEQLWTAAAKNTFFTFNFDGNFSNNSRPVEMKKNLGEGGSLSKNEIEIVFKKRPEILNRVEMGHEEFPI